MIILSRNRRNGAIDQCLRHCVVIVSLYALASEFQTNVRGGL